MMKPPRKSRAIQILYELHTLLDELADHLPTDASKGLRSGRHTPEENQSQNYSGAAGGLRMLIDKDKYFNEVRFLPEVVARLRQEGFNYPRTTVSMNLLRAVQKRVLVRLPVEGAKGREKWGYVIRK